MTTRHVLVTGGQGFLGRHVVSALCRAGCRVTATYRSNSQRPRPVADARVRWIELNLESAASINQCLRAAGPDSIIHCAAYGVDYRQQDATRAVDINVRGVAILAEAAARCNVQCMIHVGTAYEYGSSDQLLTETASLRPMSIYGATKAAGSLLAIQQGVNLSLPVCVVRPFTMYGPGEPVGKLVPSILAACQKRQRLALTPGAQIRDYLYVADVAAALWRILERPPFPAGEIFNLGSGQAIRLRDWIGQCARFFGGEALMDFGALSYRPNEIWKLVADTRKWERTFGPLAQTPLEQGLAQMIAAPGRTTSSSTVAA